MIIAGTLAGVLARHPRVERIQRWSMGTVLGAFGLRLLTDRSREVAIEEAEGEVINVFTVGYSQDQFDEQHSTIHTALIEVEVVSRDRSIGLIRRATHVGLAHIIGAIGKDRTLGGRLIDCQEIDVAPAGPSGRDVGNASLQLRAQFLTPRDDWFSILGQAGEDF